MLSQPEVEHRLAPFLPIIQRVILEAWRDWMESGKNGRWKRKRSRANYMWEELACRAEAAFSAHPHVHIHHKTQSCWFVIEGVVYRFKKSDAKGLSKNYPTQAALDYHDQQQDLPGIPLTQRLETTYVLNKLETAIQDILLVARDAERVLWCSSILHRDEGGTVVPFTSHPQTTPPATPAKTIKIPVKSARIEKNENES